MMLAVVAQTCNLIPRMREAGKSQVSGQHGLQSKNRVSETTTEFNTAKPALSYLLTWTRAN